MANQTKALWGCFCTADDGEEMLMGWPVGTRREAEDIRVDVAFYKDCPTDRLSIHRIDSIRFTRVKRSPTARVVTADNEV